MGGALTRRGGCRLGVQQRRKRTSKEMSGDEATPATAGSEAAKPAAEIAATTPAVGEKRGRDRGESANDSANPVTTCFVGGLPYTVRPSMRPSMGGTRERVCSTQHGTLKDARATSERKRDMLRCTRLARGNGAHGGHTLAAGSQPRSARNKWDQASREHPGAGGPSQEALQVAAPSEGVRAMSGG